MRFFLLIFLLASFLVQAQDDKGMQLVRNAKEKRIALIIGNANYEYDKLQNTLNDADDMADMLKKFGFEVILKKDCTKRQIQEAVEEFAEKLNEENVGLFYYSGHGAQIQGENYLIPITHNMKRESDIEYEAVSANRILKMMEQSETLANIIILDACRNNPFGKNFRMKNKNVLKQGLAEMRANGSIVVYATDAGSVASDNPGERNGLFTKYLLKNIPSGESLLDILTNVNRDVYIESKKQQSPFLYSGLRKKFYFRRLEGIKPPSVDIEMDDLKRWNDYGKKMKATFDEIQASDMQKAIKKVAWERFLRSFSQDNPYSQEDERMREDAQREIEWCIKIVQKEQLTSQQEHTIFQQQSTISEDGRYKLLSSGIIQDTNTGLEWLVGRDNDVSWDEAKEWVNSIDSKKYGTGWRMPMRQELKGIYEKGKGENNIDPIFYSKSYVWLWIWSGEKKSSSFAWYFEFHGGYEAWDDSRDCGNPRVFAIRAKYNN